MNKYLLLVMACLGIYVAVCTLLYFFQEKFLFFPTKLSPGYIFSFNQFEEMNHTVKNDASVNSVLFSSKEKKGVVFFLHGNAGCISGWAQGAALYVDNGYDVLYLDYRGYGKSTGKIKSEKQLVDDAQIVYDYLKNRYAENTIIMSGTSIGTGIAAKIAAVNHPRLLILSCPYYSLQSLIKEKVPIAPGFIVRYSLETFRFLELVKCPVTIFHGNKDDVIPLHHSIDLQKRYPKVELNILAGYGHNDLPNSEAYRKKMGILLQ